MDQKEFEDKITEVGILKRRDAGVDKLEGYQDQIFVPHPQRPPCPQCGSLKGRLLIYERKLDHKNRPYWRTKCYHCKEVWQEWIF